MALLLQTLTFEHLPPAAAAAHVALFRNVRNAEFLHGQLLARNPAFEYAFIDASVVRASLFGVRCMGRGGRAESGAPSSGAVCRSSGLPAPLVAGLPACSPPPTPCIPPRTSLLTSQIVSPTHLCSAVFRALAGQAANTLRTPNVHAEIVTLLSMSNNIVEAYRRFGITSATTDLLVVKVAPAADAPAVWAHLERHVEGDAVLPSPDVVATLTDWAKVRKYYKLNGLAWLDALPAEDKQRESEMIILNSMALRGV
jgi:EKC/KEOPS complex subunit CGI121/TPRKB